MIWFFLNLFYGVLELFAQSSDFVLPFLGLFIVLFLIMFVFSLFGRFRYG